MNQFQTKDSGERAQFDSGMVRDSEKGKPRFDLLLPLGVPYEEQMLTRDAMLMARGAEKYDARNWERARGQAELDRYHSSALRHLLQWIGGETDEDHAAAVRFNIMAGEFVKRHLHSAGEEGQISEERTGTETVVTWSPDHHGTDGVTWYPICGFCGQVRDHALTCPSYL